MFTETAIAKGLFYFGMAGLGYMGVSKFCENAGVQEPLAATARAALRFCGNLSSEFRMTPEQAAAQAQAEMAAREAYALALAKATQSTGCNTQGVTPCTK